MLSNSGLQIEWSGPRWKGAVLDKTHLVLVSGDFAIHSAVIMRANDYLKNNPSITTLEIANLIAGLIIDYTMKDAVRLYLAPLGMNEKSFMESSKLMNGEISLDLSNRLILHNVEVEALVLGCDSKNDAQIYKINNNGLVSCHTDFGFASIGIGQVHSDAHFMSENYRHNVGYYRAAYETFCAKKRSELAPGIGVETDMMIVNADGVTPIDLEFIKKMNYLYQKNVSKYKKFSERAERNLMTFDHRRTN
jgi:hypothetical protein